MGLKLLFALTVLWLGLPSAFADSPTNDTSSTDAQLAPNQVPPDQTEAALALKAMCPQCYEKAFGKGDESDCSAGSKGYSPSQTGKCGFGQQGSDADGAANKDGVSH